MKRILWSLPILLLTGCGTNAARNTVLPQDAATSNQLSQIEGTTAPAGEPGGKRLRIAVIPRSLADPVASYAQIGALRAASRFGNVEVLWGGPAKADSARQARLVDARVAQGVDGILIAGDTSPVLKASIDKAVAARIPVVTYGSDAPQSRRAGYYGIDDRKLGQRLGYEVGALMKGNGALAILSGVQGQPQLREREAGVRQALKDYPNLKILKTFYSGGEPARAVRIVNDVMRTQKPDGWVMLDGSPLGAKNGLSAIRPGNPWLVAYDPLPTTWPWIEKNYVQLVVGPKYFDEGDEGLKLVVRLLNGDWIEKFNDSGFDVVTPANVTEYRKKWATPNKMR